MKIFKIFCRCGTFQYELFDEVPKLSSEYTKAFREAGKNIGEAIESLKGKAVVLEVLKWQEEALS